MTAKNNGIGYLILNPQKAGRIGEDLRASVRIANSRTRFGRFLPITEANRETRLDQFNAAAAQMHVQLNAALGRKELSVVSQTIMADYTEYTRTYPFRLNDPELSEGFRDLVNTKMHYDLLTGTDPTKRPYLINTVVALKNGVHDLDLEQASTGSQSYEDQLTSLLFMAHHAILSLLENRLYTAPLQLETAWPADPLRGRESFEKEQVTIHFSGFRVVYRTRDSLQEFRQRVVVGDIYYYDDEAKAAGVLERYEQIHPDVLERVFRHFGMTYDPRQLKYNRVSTHHKHAGVPGLSGVFTG